MSRQNVGRGMLCGRGGERRKDSHRLPARLGRAPARISDFAGLALLRRQRRHADKDDKERHDKDGELPRRLGEAGELVEKEATLDDVVGDDHHAAAP